MIMNIAVISIYQTPYGMAATNRILAYSKGLIENGCSVTIYNPFPTDNLNKKTRIGSKGNYEGINYIYTSQRYLLKNKYLRVLHRVLGVKRTIGYVTSFRALKKATKEKKVDFLFISNDSLRDLLFYSLVSKTIKAKSVFIFDEFPTPIRHKLKLKIPKWKEFLYKLILIKIDLFVSISKELKEYYNKFSFKETFVLPVIVDTSRFDNEVDTDSKKEYLCYMGNMELAKDDVNNIIKAFSMIAEEFKTLNLYLFGTPTADTKKKLENLILSLNLGKRVIMKGRVKGTEVPKTLKEAKILVSSQPNTVRASGGFPTKLGEYLASGTPALFTNVGENSKYVKNEVHIFFVEPENPHLYADKLKKILNNYKQSLSIAKKGKEFINENYSHTIQGKYLVDFLKKNKNE